MAVNLSIKNVPEALADRLRARAEANHRSLQGELMALVESALNAPPASQMRGEYAVVPTPPPKPYSASAAPVRSGKGKSIKQSRADRSERLMDIVESESAYRRARALLGLDVPAATDTAPTAPAAKPRGRGGKRTRKAAKK